jgi:hypothetical protein
MTIQGQNDFAHFGIKGMRWGVSRKKKFSGESAPARPRATSSKNVGKTESRADQVVSRAINQGYDRTVGPPMTMFIRDIPRHSKSTDRKTQEVLDRALGQGLNRVEEQAGRAYLQGLPGMFRP